MPLEDAGARPGYASAGDSKAFCGCGMGQPLEGYSVPADSQPNSPLRPAGGRGWGTWLPIILVVTPP